MASDKKTTIIELLQVAKEAAARGDSAGAAAIIQSCIDRVKNLPVRPDPDDDYHNNPGYSW